MVIGVTGSGKSSTCNFFFDEKRFQVEACLESITSVSDAGTFRYNEEVINIIDTPGFCDGFMSTEENIHELGRAVVLAMNGVHAIALVINLSQRFTNTKAYDEMEFLGGIWKFAFVIFTQAAAYGPNEEAQLDRLQATLSNSRCPTILKEVLSKVSNRYMLLECSQVNDEKYRIAKLDELIKMINIVLSNNDNKLYKNYLMKTAFELIEKEKQEITIRQKMLSLCEEKSKAFLAVLEQVKAELLKQHNKKRSCIIQ